MLGINSYLAGGMLVLFLLLSGTTYYFYKENQSKLVEIASLKEEQTRLEGVIKNRDIQIEFKDKNLKIQEDELKANREEIEKKSEELKAISESLENEPGINDDAAPSLKKLFESLKGRK